MDLVSQVAGWVLARPRLLGLGLPYNYDFQETSW